MQVDKYILPVRQITLPCDHPKFTDFFTQGDVYPVPADDTFQQKSDALFRKTSIQPYALLLVDSDVVFATCYLGTKEIFFSSGLLKLLSEDEALEIIAHELGEILLLQHCNFMDALIELDEERALKVDESTWQELTDNCMAAMHIRELFADALGALLSEKNRAIGVLQKVLAEDDLDPFHPAPADRIDALRNEIYFDLARPLLSSRPTPGAVKAVNKVVLQAAKLMS